MDESLKETDTNTEKSTKEIKPETPTSPLESEYDSADGSTYSEPGSKPGSVSEAEVALERESGDGQESVPAKKVDDDEDKKNPQYIPKRGTFYEHDDRTADDIEAAVDDEAAEKADKEAKKKVWQDKKERWNHDRFNDNEQQPKSRSELVAIYGYDIRNEDGPPRARRRRRYGRGPNKYTRNWEDEDAYGKAQPVRTKKPPLKKENISNEEFPPLVVQDSIEIKKDNRKIYNDKPDNLYNERYDKQSENNGNLNTPSSSSYNQDYLNKNQSPQVQQRFGSGRVIKPKKEIKDSDYRGFTTKTRQVRNVKYDQKIIPKQPIQQQYQQQLKNEDFVQTQNFTNRNMQDLEKEMGKLNVADYKNTNKYTNNQHQQNRQTSVPPRLQQSEQKGSKRYSSIRQRSLPETTTPAFNQHSNFYPNEYTPQSHLNHPSPPTQIPATLAAAAATMASPVVPVTATPILPAPQFAPAFPQPPPPPFLQAPPPNPYLPPHQQTTPIINYVSPPPPPPGQPQFPQGFQGFQQPFNPVTQPDGLYQQTGITYYSTDQQQINQRQVVHQKRPKAAIPIVAPPNMDYKGHQMNQNIGEEEEIHEHIIENNYLMANNDINQ